MREFVLDFGLLGDTLMEQGRVMDAAEAYQKMIDLKPFYQSYTRAAHLRWIRGDLQGAIEMMNSAVKSASLRDRESVAWAYSRLAYYELQRGRLVEAGRMAEASLQYVPDYAAALLARGRVELAQNKYTDAVKTLEHAARLNPLPEYQWTLSDALRLLNRNEEAAALERQLMQDGLASDPRTLALYLSTRGNDGGKAVDLARREMGNRRDVFTLDALAWALASTGQVREASTLIDSGPCRRDPGWPPFSSRGGDRRRRRTFRRRPALGAQGAHVAIHAAAFRAGGAPEGNRSITPDMR